MSDYIKREDILDRTVKRNSIWNGITNACGQGLEEIVNGIPSADVAPVRHGKWIVGYGGNGWNDWYVFECPLCGIKIEDRNGRGMDWEYNYCPNCGAKMDGEENV